MKRQDGKKKVISQAFLLTLALYIFKSVLYFNSIIISNQSKYYLAINRENFLQIQYGFCRHALLIHYHLWQLVIERACTKNSRKLMQVCFLTGGAEIMNAQGSDWYLTSKNKYTDLLMSSVIIAKVCRDSKECLHSNLEIHFSETLLFLCFFTD